MHPRVRLLAGFLLLVALFGMGVHADATHDRRWPHPTADELHADYDRYTGERTLLFGTVERVTNGRATVRVEHSAGSFEMTVTDFEAAVQPGGTVQILGTLGAGQSIAAETVVVVSPSGSSTLYKYAVSLVAVAVFLLAFFRYWWPDFDSFQLEARENG